MKEEWRDIKGYEGYYQVSNMGRVKSLARLITGKNGKQQLYPEKLRVLRINRTGYPQVSLYRENIQKTSEVHVLMAKAFLDYTPKPGMAVDHINRVKTDNRIENLRVVSQSMNCKNAILKRTPTSKYNGVHQDKRGRWLVRITIKNKTVSVGQFNTEIDAARAFDGFCIKYKLDRVLNYATA